MFNVICKGKEAACTIKCGAKKLGCHGRQLHCKADCKLEEIKYKAQIFARKAHAEIKARQAAQRIKDAEAAARIRAHFN